MRCVLAYKADRKAMTQRGTTMACYMIITGEAGSPDKECDAIWDTEEQAKREAKDLRAMGLTVKIRKFETWQLAEEYEDKLRGM
jgi:hypothetical protein